VAECVPDTAGSGHTLAERWLADRSPVLGQLIETVGPCTLQTNDDGFAVLVRMVIAQLISTSAARTIYGRVEALLNTITPSVWMGQPIEALRACGLSPAKVRTLTQLAERLQQEPTFLSDLHNRTDDEVLKALCALRGIGPWTGHMYLMFAIGRPDIWPIGDLGIRLAVRDLFELPAEPKGKLLLEFAESWRPHRTIASWYLWRSRGFVPQSGI